MLLQQGFDFSDMGVTRALAASEAERWLWETWGSGWDEVAGIRQERSFPISLRNPRSDDFFHL